MANPNPGASAAADLQNGDSDPFTTPTSTDHRHRYSSFDTQLFSAYSGGSPWQTKRALEAHLAETERRLQEASSLGTALVNQRSELSDRLKDVEARQNESEISPELRKKLIEVEKEFNEVGRETARVFVPRSRVTSNESNADANADDGELSSEAVHSPSKVNVPQSRKQRNQAPNRVHDIKLATDISTSLLTQLRELQAVLSEKEEALRAAHSDKSQLEVEVQGLSQRLRALDESEQRYKDENWNLETNLRDLSTASGESATREQRLNQALDAIKSEKAALERDFEDLKQAHGKMSDDNAAAKKQLESELSTARRGLSAGEAERGALQRKIDDLANQNTDLARAVSYRFRPEDQATGREIGSESEGQIDDSLTPEQSPPPSPTKGTPRHGHLESETLRSSLHHAQRMIQNLKNNIHREKTEKIELRRMLQDARDEVEGKRSESGGVGASNVGKKRRQPNQQDGKRLSRLDKLGGSRTGVDEILLDDEWEDGNALETPSKTIVSRSSALRSGRSSGVTSSNEEFETATDNFATASERDTTADDTDAFHTGAESLSGDSEGELTETEATDGKRDVTLSPSQRIAGPVKRNSYLSTASTSDDDLTGRDLKTPVKSQQPKYRLKMNKGQRRSSREIESTENTPSTAYRDSPASQGSNLSPTPVGQSLFAELNNLDEYSDEGSNAQVTPSRPGRLSERGTPAGAFSRPPVPPKPIMVDSGTMTEMETETKRHSTAGKIGSAMAGAIGFSRSGSKSSTRESKRTPNRSSTLRDSTPSSLPGTPRDSVVMLPEKKSVLSIAAISAQHTEPIEPPVQAAKSLSATGHSRLASVASQETRPIEKLPEEGTFSPVIAQETEPDDVRATAGPDLRSVDPAVRQRIELLIREGIPESHFSISNVATCDTQPVEPTLPKSTAAVADVASDEGQDKSRMSGLFGSVLGWNRPAQEAEPKIAEDENSQRDKTEPGSRELHSSSSGRMPLGAIDGNAGQREASPGKASKTPVPTSHESTQTVISGEEMDQILANKGTTAPPLTLFTPGRPGSRLASPGGPELAANVLAKNARRPGSSSSARGRDSDPPPLPTDHRELIAAAAAHKASLNGTGAMGPPTAPASAYRNSQQARLSTPVGQDRPGSIASTTPRPNRFQHHNGEPGTPGTRRSSVSSFASELDHRFNISRNAMGAGADAFEGISDPRMIQAITQTMIGEWLWKYTRKTGRGQHSENRHRRFFWVHPYTRTLYWSEHDASAHTKAEFKAKSVPIESVRVVNDDNNSPPGLHRKSLIVVTPGRSIKFTATTGQRHETWFNALSYLLIRSTAEPQEIEGITAEDVEEFNPSAYNRSASRMTGRSRVSLSSYNSRTTRASSPSRVQIPTLGRPRDASSRRASRISTSTATQMQSQTQNQGSASSRLSTLLRPNGNIRGSFASRRSRYSAQEGTIYDAPVVRDSAEELRQVMEAQENESDRLENVRACCDGKHDVGSIGTAPRRGLRGLRSSSQHHHHHHHSHAEPATAVAE